MTGLVSFGSRRSYDDFKKQVPEKIQPLYDLIRDYCLGLADNVVEDVRMHRIVFCKSITLRWFADVAPEGDLVVIKIQKGRKDPLGMAKVSSQEDFERIKPVIKEALETIR